MDLRQQLLAVHTDEEFKKIMWDHAKLLAEQQNHPERKSSSGEESTSSGNSVSFC